MEAAQRFLEAHERCQVGSELWAKATARAFDILKEGEFAKVAKPEWWSDEGLKALSVRVVQAAPNEQAANQMRAAVLSGAAGVLEVVSRSAAELREAAAHFDRAAALCDAPAFKAVLAKSAGWCRRKAEGR